VSAALTGGGQIRGPKLREWKKNQRPSATHPSDLLHTHEAPTERFQDPADSRAGFYQWDFSPHPLV
jgi:hypothetical protein